MKLFYNRNQLARHLGIAHQTLRERISKGIISADAKDGRGEDLFSRDAIAKYLAKHRELLKSGARMPKGKNAK